MYQRMVVFLFVLSVTCILGDAQEKQTNDSNGQATCPISFEQVKMRDMGHKSGYTYSLRVKWKNTSEKKIDGAKFQAEYADVTGDLHKEHGTYGAEGTTSPGKSSTYVWGYDILGNKGFKAVRIWLVKVSFDDGSVWTDDGKRSCFADSQRS